MSFPTTDPQAALAQFASSLTFDQLPQNVRDAAQIYLIDTVACILGGSGSPGIQPILEEVREWQGATQSTVAVYGDRVPAPLAAFVNATMLHALDYDDTVDANMLHANVCVVPALLASAEARRRVSGKDLLAAYAAGLEVSCRLALAATGVIAAGWLPTTLFGCFGATAAVGRIMNLDATQMQHAFGIVYNAAGGNRQGLLDGALTRRLQPGFYAQAAVTAARLAQKGITGPHRAFTGIYGLFPLIVGDTSGMSRLTDELGIRFDLLDIGLKAYPCARGIHKCIDAALELVRHGVRADEVEDVVVYVGTRGAADLLGQPFEIRENPTVDAQFSIAYSVAAALRRGGVSLSDFDEEAIRDPAVNLLAKRVRTEVDAGLDGTVQITLRNGRVHSNKAVLPSGHPKRPMSRDALIVKLLDCARRSPMPFPDAQLHRIVKVIERLEDAPEAQDLIRETIAPSVFSHSLEDMPLL